MRFSKFEITFQIPSKPELICSRMLASVSSSYFLFSALMLLILAPIDFVSCLSLSSIVCIFSFNFYITASLRLSESTETVSALTLCLAYGVNEQLSIFSFSSILLLMCSLTDSSASCLLLRMGFTGLSSELSNLVWDSTCDIFYSISLIFLYTISSNLPSSSLILCSYIYCKNFSASLIFLVASTEVSR